MTGVSYVITVYNKAAALPKVIESLKAQVGDFDKEYIFIDDGSTDGSAEVIKSLCPEATVVSQNNSGPSTAVNRGLRAATKEWVYLADGDDYIYSNATIMLFNAAKANNSKLAFGRHPNDPAKDERHFDGTISVFNNPLKKCIEFLCLGAGTIVERRLISESGGCDERVFVQDYSIALKLSRLTDKFVCVNRLVACNVDAGQQRLSGNKLQENHDVAAARYFFIKDNLDITYEHKHLALKLFLRKAFKWHLRREGLKALWSKHLWRYLAARFGFHCDNEKIVRWMKEGLEVYKGKVRRP